MALWYPDSRQFSTYADVFEDGASTPPSTGNQRQPEYVSSGKLTTLLAEKLQQELDRYGPQEGNMPALPMRPPGIFFNFSSKDAKQDSPILLPDSKEAKEASVPAWPLRPPGIFFALPQKEMKAQKMSLGTLGHPYTGSQGGWMNGSGRQDCHQFQWSPTEDSGVDELLAYQSQVRSSTKPPGVEPMRIEHPQRAEAPSFGSIGHPESCGPACKFSTRSKGCKDGSLCTYCHLCCWNRHGRKIFKL
eukprot:TRINITY_DN109381_c0_g1_i1.p1 TRINITY_DN109381_c0_g1~~TRINITY_DN109381_c0_g1_i1.p1  ORF type:complete len:246 (-),score=56.52 TRINITY_DN109381_c0_g1_i1:34-771(-)